MKKFFYLLVVLTIQSPLFSQTKDIPEKRSQKGFAKIDFLSIEMPFTTIPNEQNLGFTGIHYNLLLNKSFYTGIGIYVAVIGSRGGFFYTWS